jgi:hypothetical protein
MSCLEEVFSETRMQPPAALCDKTGVITLRVFATKGGGPGKVEKPVYEVGEPRPPRVVDNKQLRTPSQR